MSCTSPQPSANLLGHGGGQKLGSQHPFFSTVWIDDADSVALPSMGDLWVNCWSDDDAMYVVNGDGKGFTDAYSDIQVSRIDGRPDDPTDPLRATPLSAGDAVAPTWSGWQYERKPTGMLCSDGDLYLAVQDLRVLTFSDAPVATIVHSSDHGRTWSWDTQAPMFNDAKFTTIMFADFGRGGEHAFDEFAYAYGLDDNWSSVYSSLPPQTKLYLARVPRSRVQDRSAWEFFHGLDAQGAPTWTSELEERVAVLEDDRRVYTMPIDPMLDHQNMTALSQGGVVYDAGLQRYIYTTWTMYTFELYEAPQPWGPWTHFYSKDFGVFPWTDSHSGGYGTSLPSKFISEDGSSALMHANEWQAGVAHYQYSLRRVRMTPFHAADPTNRPSRTALSAAGGNAVPLVRAAHGGHAEYMNDGVLVDQSEDSWTGEQKTDDYWGYTWPTSQRVNTLRFTTGAPTSGGGFFVAPVVQFRAGGDWLDVTHQSISPSYASDASVLNYQTYTFRFDEVVTDGVRLYGAAGGPDFATSIAELGVFYE